MQELGLEGWLHGSRMRVRVRRDGQPVEGAGNARQPMSATSARALAIRGNGQADPREMVGMVGLGVLAAGTAVWAFQRYEDSQAVAGILSRTRSGAGMGRTFAAAATMLLGIGALAMSALRLTGRRTRR